jgi:Cu2+-containing amine oxidase
VKSHPLDPLTHDEIKAAAGAIKAAAADKKLQYLRFNVVTLAVRMPPSLLYIDWAKACMPYLSTCGFKSW